MLRRIVYGLVALAIAFFGGAYLLPETTTISRSIETTAPPSKVYTIVSSVKRMYKLLNTGLAKDPYVKEAFSGPEQGVGAKLTWIDHITKARDIGSTEVIVAEPDKRVEMNLELESMDRKSMNQVKFIFVLEPAGTGTRITWSFDVAPALVFGFDFGPATDPVSRWLGLFLDKETGSYLEQSLASLKALAEKA